MRSSTSVMCVALLAAICLTPSMCGRNRKKDRDLERERMERQNERERDGKKIRMTVLDGSTGSSTKIELPEHSELSTVKRTVCDKKHIPFNECNYYKLHAVKYGLRVDLLRNDIKEGTQIIIQKE